MISFIIAVATALVSFLPVEELDQLVILVILALLGEICSKLLNR